MTQSVAFRRGTKCDWAKVDDFYGSFRPRPMSEAQLWDGEWWPNGRGTRVGGGNGACSLLIAS